MAPYFLHHRLAAVVLCSPVAHADESASNSEAKRSWYYEEPYVDYCTRSWECYRVQKYKFPMDELAPLLDMDLSAEQKALTQRTMVRSISGLAMFAFAEEDYQTQVRHLKEAVACDPSESEASERKLLIAQVYRLLEQWPECIRIAEEAIDVFNGNRNRPDLDALDTAHMAECHLKNGNFERVRHWIARTIDIARGKEIEGLNEEAWEHLISQLESALPEPEEASE